MELVLLGTGTPGPDPDRAGAATLVHAGPYELLFDFGRAVVMRLAGAGVNLGSLTALLITHLHSDHTWALNDVLTTRWITQFEDAPLPVIGPVGTAEFVERTLASMDRGIEYRMAHHDDLNWAPTCDVRQVSEGSAFETDGVRVNAAVVDHGVVRPALSYRVEADGTAVVIAGDTKPCPALDRLCADADVYVQTVLRRDLVEAAPVPAFQQILDYHSSVEDAAQTAARAGVRTLVLTHLIPGATPDTEPEWAAIARDHFDGEVVVGRDLMTVAVGR